MLPIYFLSLGVSSCLVGAFVRQVMASQGYVADFQGGLLLAAGAGCAYLVLQCLYMAAVRLLKPTRDSAPLVSEVLSHLGVVALLPYLLHVNVAWPDPRLERAEPLLYLAAFTLWHAFFKLVSFFAALRAKPAGRLPALAWLAAVAICAVGANALFQRWGNTLEAARLIVPETTQRCQVGDEFGDGRLMPEGATFECPVTAYPGQSLTFRWANASEQDPENDPLRTVYVNVQIDGRERYAVSKPLTLQDQRWTELRVASESIPKDAHSCTVSWSVEKAPKWRKLMKFRPVVVSRRQLVMSGPYEHEIRTDSTAPSFLIVLVEGLGANHVSGLGYKRSTTPNLDRLAAASVSFDHAYTTSPDPDAACMTLLTGLNPLRHGVLGSHHGPLPASYKTLAERLCEQHYVTAAFTEEGPAKTSALVVAGANRGFETYDPTYTGDEGQAADLTEVAQGSAPKQPSRKPGRSAATIEKVRRWMAAHAEEKFCVFLRVRELSDLAWRDQYAPGFVENPQSASHSDVYDSIAQYLDNQLGTLFAYVKDHELRKNTCIVVTSTHGVDFATASPVLSEVTLRIPLIIGMNGLEKAQRSNLVGLLDLSPTILALAGSTEGTVLEGADILHAPGGAEPISLSGAPLQVSLRTDRWRYTWKTNFVPFQTNSTPPTGDAELFEASQFGRRGGVNNVATRNPNVVAQYKKALEDYLIKSQLAWNQSTAPPK